MIVIVMGVSGSGKTTIAQALALATNWEFYDADDFHSSEGKKKMSQGVPLTDTDRAPWLHKLQVEIDRWINKGRDVILACSALKAAYRQILRCDQPQVKLVYLKGSYELLHQRLMTRPNHFMNINLLQSQFATLEEPSEDEAIRIDIANDIPTIIQDIKNAFMTQQVIGIDLGGTDIKLGRYTETGDCLLSLKIPTPQPPTPDLVIPLIAQSILQLDPHQEAIALGIGTPGPADAAGRIAKLAINLGGWVNVPLAERLEVLTGLPTVVGNDANCAALGEGWLGAGRPYKNWILLTLGTGVGGAIFLNGELFVGHNGTAGELGLVTVDLNGHPCNSGNQGSLEQHVSAQAIRRRTGLEPGDLAVKAKAGDQDAIAFWKQYGRELAAGLASSIYVLAPEAIVIGGGISAAADLFLPSMKAEVERRVKPTSRECLQFAIAKLGNQAGNAGAAKLAWQKYETLTQH